MQITRKRTSAVAPSPALTSPFAEGSTATATEADDNAERTAADDEEDDGGQDKNPQKKSFKNQPRRPINRNESTSLERLDDAISHFLAKLGNLRIVDVVLALGIMAKLASMLYSRVNELHALHSPMRNPSSSEIHLAPLESISFESDAILSDRAAERRRQQNIKFHSPQFYRRDDDTFGIGNFKGAFTRYNFVRKFHQTEEELKIQGYALIDDVVDTADRRQDITQMALLDSFPRIHSLQNQINSDREEEEDEDIETSTPPLAMGSWDSDEEELRHYVDDGGEWDPYYAFDDDFVRGTRGTGMEEKNSTQQENAESAEEDENESAEEESDDIAASEGEVCIRPSFYRINHPTCNDVHASASGYQWLLGEEVYTGRWQNKETSRKHEIPLSRYLGSGYYRNAFVLQRPFVDSNQSNNDYSSNEWDEVVFKSMKQLYAVSGEGDDDEINDLGWGYSPEDTYSFVEYLEDMRKDAMVLELLSTSSRTVNIYSYCNMASVTEFAPGNIEDYIMPTAGQSPKRFRRRGAKENSVKGPVNEIPPQEKLEIALGMAKAIAEIHGFIDGPIAHVDVQVGQFIRGRDGVIKIIDFNRAEALLYGVNQESYCKFTNGQPKDGVFRAPEENIDAPLNEKIDVYSLGNVFYSILTGLQVYKDYGRSERMNRIIEGITEPIDETYFNSRSLEEAFLAETIEWCWTYDAAERPSIFEIVEYLEEAVEACSKPDHENIQH